MNISYGWVVFSLQAVSRFSHTFACHIRTYQKMSGGLAMDPLDMVDVCLRCYHQRRPGDGNRLRINGCYNSQHQWDRNQHHSPHRQAVTTVIDASGACSYNHSYGNFYVHACSVVDTI